MKEKFIVKRKYFSLTKSKKEIQSFVMEFILVLIIDVNPEPKIFFFFLRIVSLLFIAKLSK